MSAAANSAPESELPGPDELRRLLEWEPEGGVISAFVPIDPADRGDAWRVALEREMRTLLSSEHAKQRSDLQAGANAVLARFPQNAPHKHRAQIGFVEVGGGRRREQRWYPSQIAPRRLELHHGRRPLLRPLVELVERAGRIGVAVVSTERVHIWEWDDGLVRRLEGWVLETMGLDWRERKAQRSADPARVRGGKASGHDQFAQRLEANRDRFLTEAGGLTAGVMRRREWRELLGFGAKQSWQQFAEGLGRVRGRLVDSADIINEPAADIEARIEAVLPQLEQARDAALVKTVEEAAYSGKERASLGPQETLEALEQGRVEQLLFDADRDYRGEGIEEGLTYEVPEGAIEPPVTEILIERALGTSARVTPVFGEAAALLDEHDGVVALLRY